jgi:hypothetical protein
MTTCRVLTKRSLRMLGVLASGEDADASDASDALEALQSMLLSLPGMWWTDVETDEDYTAEENERIRVNSNSAVTVTIPVVVGSEEKVLTCCGQTILKCEGYDDRAPKDGARVQVTDTNSNAALTYYYCADVAAWMPVESLTLNSEVPLNADMIDGLAAMLAVRLAPEYGVELSPVVVGLAGEARTKMRARYGRRANFAADAAMLGPSRWSV